MVVGAGALESGEVFAGDYRVERPLAEGGMGAVYLVEQLSTGKRRALKLMHPELARDADCRRRFVQEARVGSRIESEHVVEVLTAGLDEARGALYLVMELLDGEDLWRRVARGGPLDFESARALFRELCHAVGAAHAAGIVHRDLKPENVFMSRSRRAGEEGRASVKVLDFGIAKLVAERATTGQTVGAIGTPAWMAPEQAEPGPVTPAADVWALGLILFFVLTGRPFWRSARRADATFAQILREVLVAEIPSLGAAAKEVGMGDPSLAAFDAVFARCLARDPAARFPDARALAAALDPVFARLSTSPASAPRSDGGRPDSARLLVNADADASAATHYGVGESAPLELELDLPRPSRPDPTRPLPAPPAAPPQPLPVAQRLPHESAFATTIARRSAAPPAWVWAVGVGVFLTVVSAGVALRRRVRDAAEPAAASAQIASAAPGDGTAAGLPACRICTTSVEITESGLERDQISKAIEADFDRLDRQCLTAQKSVRIRRGPRTPAYRPTRGVVTVALTIREGRAVIHDVAASSVNDSSDECLADAMSEVAFPTSPYKTVAKYTLRYDTAVR